MVVMADTNRILEPGTVVKCVTAYGQEIQGEVQSYDHTKKAVVILSDPSDSSQHNRNDFHLLNLTHLHNLEILEDVAADRKLLPLPALDMQRLTKRTRDQCRQKKSIINSIGIGVSPLAQELYNTISKTIEDVAWHGKTIVVLGDVDIPEPYSLDDLKTKPGRKSTTMSHIAKIVKKFYEDRPTGHRM